MPLFRFGQGTGIDPNASARGEARAQARASQRLQQFQTGFNIGNSLINTAIKIENQFGDAALESQKIRNEYLRAQTDSLQASSEKTRAELAKTEDPNKVLADGLENINRARDANAALQVGLTKENIQKATNNGNHTRAAELWTEKLKDSVLTNEQEGEAFRAWWGEFGSLVDPTSEAHVKAAGLFERATATKEQRRLIDQIAGVDQQILGNPNLSGRLLDLGFTSPEQLNNATFEEFPNLDPENRFQINGQNVTEEEFRGLRRRQTLGQSAVEVTGVASGKGIPGNRQEAINRLKQGRETGVITDPIGRNIVIDEEKARRNALKPVPVQRLLNQNKPPVKLSTAQNSTIKQVQAAAGQKVATRETIKGQIANLEQAFSFIDNKRNVVNPQTGETETRKFDPALGPGIANKAARTADGLFGSDLQTEVFDKIEQAGGQEVISIISKIGSGAANSEGEQANIRRLAASVGKSEAANRGFLTMLRAKQQSLQDESTLQQLMLKHEQNLDNYNSNLTLYFSQQPEYGIGKDENGTDIFVENQDRQSVTDWYIENNPEAFGLPTNREITVLDGLVYFDNQTPPEREVRDRPEALNEPAITSSQDSAITQQLKVGEVKAADRSMIAPFAQGPTQSLMQQIAFVENKKGIGVDTGNVDTDGNGLTDREDNIISEFAAAKGTRPDPDSIPSFQNEPDPRLVQGVGFQESSGGRNLIGVELPNGKGRAEGPFQFIPATGKAYWKKLGFQGEYDPFDTERSYRMSKAYLGDLLEDYNGNVAFALSAYNGGPKGLNKAIAAAKKAEQPLDWDTVKLYLKDYKSAANYKQNTEYVDKIMGRRTHYASADQVPGAITEEETLATPEQATPAALEDREGFGDAISSFVTDVATRARNASPEFLQFQPEDITGAASSLTNSISLGLFDEGMAELANTFGLDGDAKREAFNEARDRFSKENPETAAGLDIAGALVPGAGGVKLAGKIAGKAAGPIRSALANSGVAGLEGFTFGAADSDGPARNRVIQGIETGGLTGGLALALPPALRSLARSPALTGSAIGGVGNTLFGEKDQAAFERLTQGALAGGAAAKGGLTVSKGLIRGLSSNPQASKEFAEIVRNSERGSIKLGDGENLSALEKKGDAKLKQILLDSNATEDEVDAIFKNLEFGAEEGIPTSIVSSTDNQLVKNTARNLARPEQSEAGSAEVTRILTEKFGETGSEAQISRIENVLDTVYPSKNVSESAIEFANKASAVINKEKSVRSKKANEAFGAAFREVDQISSSKVDDVLSEDQVQDLLRSKELNTNEFKDLPTNNFKKLEELRQLMGDKIGEALRAGRDKAARQWTGWKNTLQDEMELASDNYKQAIKQYGDDSAVLNQATPKQVKILKDLAKPFGSKFSGVQFLRSVFNDLQPEEVGKLRESMGEEAFDGFKAGLRAKLQQSLGNVTTEKNSDIAVKILGNVDNQKLINEVLGPEEGGALMKKLRAESAVAKEAAKLSEGSSTQALLAGFAKSALQDLTLAPGAIPAELANKVVRAVVAGAKKNPDLDIATVRRLLRNEEGLKSLERILPGLKQDIRARATEEGLIRSSAAPSVALGSQTTE